MDPSAPEGGRTDCARLTVSPPGALDVRREVNAEGRQERSEAPGEASVVSEPPKGLDLPGMPRFELLKPFRDQRSWAPRGRAGEEARGKPRAARGLHHDAGRGGASVERGGFAGPRAVGSRPLGPQFAEQATDEHELGLLRGAARRRRPVWSLRGVGVGVEDPHGSGVARAHGSSLPSGDRKAPRWNGLAPPGRFWVPGRPIPRPRSSEAPGEPPRASVVQSSPRPSHPGALVTVVTVVTVPPIDDR